MKHYLLSLVCLLLVTTSCAQSDTEQISTTCNNFIKGRLALRQGDSLLIRSVTEDSLYKLIMLNHKYVKMLKAPVVRADLGIRVKSVEVNDSCASCLMTGYEYYQIKLCKYNDVWRVKGENDIYATTERIQRAQKKIDDYKIELKKRPAVDSVIKVVNQFFKDVKHYFNTEESDGLSTTCNEDTVKFIKSFYTYAKRRSGLELLHKEMKAPNFMVGDGIFEDDRTLFKFYNEEIYIVLRKTDGNYVIHGFNKTDSQDFNDAKIDYMYLDLLRAMKLTRQPRYRDKAFH